VLEVDEEIGGEPASTVYERMIGRPAPATGLLAMALPALDARNEDPRAMAGHFQQARTLLDDPTAAGPTRRFTTDEVAGFLDDTGFEVTAMHAVRVFVDLVPSSLVDLEPGAASALVELEKAVADRPEYLPLGTQLHVLATRR
jgi:hypothetical protein